MCQIEIQKLTKYYGKKKVFHNLNFNINSDKYNFLIGDNGSGKSTFIKCLTDLTTYQGNINKNNLVVAYCPEKINLPDYITIRNFLLVLGHVNKISKSYLLERINYYLKIFDLLEYQQQYIIKLSLGTKQKISIIQTLMQDADIYLFDEPLNGLDQESQKTFIKELRLLKKRCKLIIITTHQIHKYPFRKINKIDFNNKGQYVLSNEIASEISV